MSDRDLDKIREIATGHKIEPRSEAWGKLNQKLSSKKTKVRLINYRNMSIAAILISVISVSAVFSMYLRNHDPQVFASNEQFRPIVLEELTVEDGDPFFDAGNIATLRDAYAKAGF